MSHYRLKEIEMADRKILENQKVAASLYSQKQFLLPKSTQSFSLESSISFYIPNIATQISVSISQPPQKEREREGKRY